MRARGQREREFRGEGVSQSRLNAQCITGLRRRRISPSNSAEVQGGGPKLAGSYLHARRNPSPSQSGSLSISFPIIR